MRAKSLEEIKRIFREHKPILAKNSTLKINLFGSYVRREETPSSNIDILVEFEETN